MLQASTGNLSYFAQLMGDYGYKIVVLAHTHEYVLEKKESSQKKSPLVYANTGGCCSCFAEEKKVSYVEIELNS
jgi:predicted phosphodiesterase